MKYTVDVTILKPLDYVIEVFDNEENLYKWMEGLQNYQTIEGTAGEPGSQAELIFQMGKRKIVMIETLHEKNLPDVMRCTYTTPGVVNNIRMQFSEPEPGKTLLVSENEFIFSGFMMKVMSVLMRWMFPKQSLKYLNNFKHFAETGNPAC